MLNLAALLCEFESEMKLACFEILFVIHTFKHFEIEYLFPFSWIKEHSSAYLFNPDVFFVSRGVRRLQVIVHFNHRIIGQTLLSEYSLIHDNQPRLSKIFISVVVIEAVHPDVKVQHVLLDGNLILCNLKYTITDTILGDWINEIRPLAF